MFHAVSATGCPAIPHLLGPTIANTEIAGSLVFTAP
jgi:hypothetical protein